MSKETNPTDMQVEEERRFFSEDPSLDPYDLSALRPKPKPMRPFLACTVILACLYLLYDFRLEIAYYLSSSTPASLGSLEEGDTKAQLGTGSVESNRFVSLAGVPNYPPFLWESNNSFGRYTAAGEHTRLLVFPKQEGQTIQLRHIGKTLQNEYLPLAVVYNENNSYPREQLRGQYEGRLLRASEAPFFDSVRAYLWKTSALDIPNEAYVLFCDELPADMWVYALGGLLAVLAIFFNVFVIIRYFRALRAAPR